MCDNQIPFFQKKVALRMKGFAAIYIMLSHLIHSPFWQLGFFLFGGGYLFVGVFFFYSGYGLKKSSEKSNYLDGFPKRKLVKIYLPFLLAETCYTLVTALYNGDCSHFIIKCLGIELSNTILWYVIEILALYMLFYVFEKCGIPTIMYAIVWVGFALVASYLDIGSWWYVSTPCFILGIICAKYESRICMIKRVWWKKVVSLIFFLTTDYLHRWVSEFKISFLKIPSTYLCVALMIISAISFIITLILSVEDYSFETKILNLCGELSYLIYLWHGFFIAIISQFEKNEILLTIEVTLATLLFTVVYRHVETRISKEKMKNQSVGRIR